MAAGDARLEDEIIGDRKTRDQIELLEHEAEPVTAQLGAAGIAELCDKRVREPNLAAIGGVQPPRSGAAACSCRCRIRLIARRSRRRLTARSTPRSTVDGLARRAIALGQSGDAEYGGRVGAEAMAVPHCGFWYFQDKAGRILAPVP